MVVTHLSGEKLNSTGLGDIFALRATPGRNSTAGCKAQLENDLLCQSVQNSEDLKLPLWAVPSDISSTSTVLPSEKEEEIDPEKGGSGVLKI